MGGMLAAIIDWLVWFDRPSRGRMARRMSRREIHRRTKATKTKYRLN